MRADVDKQKGFHAGLRVFVFREHNPAVVGHRAGVQPGKLAAQVMGFQARVVEVFSHALDGRFNLRLQPGILAREPMKRAFKSGRENQVVHGSFAATQAGHDALGRLGFQFAVAEGFHGLFGRRCCLPPPRLNAPTAEQSFEQFLIINRQCFGVGQYAV